MLLKISIITPCFNAEKYIEETIESIISQRGDFDIEYIIVDGASTDNTTTIITEYKNSIDNCSYPIKCNSVSIKLLSETDSGMYEALSKGLKLATGDIIAYQNADDFYLPNAFSAVMLTFSHYKPIRWLTGVISGYNENGNICLQKLPYLYNSSYMRQGVYGKELPYIQQESCFWRRSLLRYIDMERLASLSYAGDFYIWSRFAEANELRILNVPLSGFRKHGENKSADMDAYWHEYDQCTTEQTINLSKDRDFLLHKKAWQLSSPEILNINQSIIRLDQARLTHIKELQKSQEKPQKLLEKPLISVITVTYNDENGLVDTLASVAKQTFENIEYIVIDGGSTDNSHRLFDQYKTSIDTLVSEPDHGIYDAMNKGIARARGDWIIFMNAGDCFHDDTTLALTSDKLDSEVDVIYGDRIYKDMKGDERLEKAKPIETIFSRMPFCHQSTFVKTSILKKAPFNLTYKYGADYNFFVEQYVIGKKFLHIDQVICIFVQGGKSESGLRPHIEALKILLDNAPDKKSAGSSVYLRSLRSNFQDMLRDYLRE
jgi:glycosyltransferase involved in cell wall biosynthesis